MPDAKQKVMQLLQALPDDSSLEDIQYHLYMMLKTRKSSAKIAEQAAAALSRADGAPSPEHWLAGLMLSTADWNVFIASLDDSETTPRPQLSAALRRHRDWQKSRVLPPP